jgi:hypothetical protein
MTFEVEFLALMTASLTYFAYTSNDAFGEPIYGTAVTCPCHFTYRNKAMRNDREENVISTAQAQCPPPGFIYNSIAVPTFTVDDEVQLPDGLDRRVLNVVASTDESGTIHHQSLDLT